MEMIDMSDLRYKTPDELDEIIRLERVLIERRKSTIKQHETAIRGLNGKNGGALEKIKWAEHYRDRYHIAKSESAFGPSI